MASKEELALPQNQGGYPVPAPTGGPDGELRELKHRAGSAATRGESTEDYDDEVVRVLDDNDRGPKAAEQLNKDLAETAEARRKAAEKREKAASTSDTGRTTPPQGRSATPPGKGTAK